MLKKTNADTADLKDSTDFKKSTRLCCTQRRRVLFHTRLGKFQKLTKSIAASERILFLQKEKDV
jgi:hypothetical protein